MTVAIDDVSRFRARWEKVGLESLARWTVTPFNPDRRIMRPGEPRWAEFFTRLEGPEGCNFHEREGDGKVVWACDHTHRRAAAILATMPEVDVLASLNLFALLHGCKCDCEILLNLRPDA